MVPIDVTLVRRLISNQFPQLAGLPVEPVEFGGCDNRTLHLGEQMIVRLPSGPDYSSQVENEQYRLPKLAPLLSLPTPTPLALGNPAEGYPWN
jgi:aminoglycoside phosphotransferase (APT) family kinase protein